ncbi:DegT/DnrJ/EryC1/StrS family aminotransferase, partial [Candidatus Pelagibacter sp.]|nr:DegT/DnrJ/EryC1/StrS family aminotransferase [Candidatus Pelagibacter sp.]
MINFWSYKQEYKKNKKKFLKKIDKTLSKGVVFFGDELKKFEKKFKSKYKSKYGSAVGSGTDALLIAINSININKGDEIITASNTAIPTISAIINSGAIPKLVDVGEDYLIDCSKIEHAITKKTKAIIPVHLYGQSCDMDKIIKISKKYKLKIIEDCAQSQGAMYKNKFVGTIGDLGCFSFYPTKILGAYGDGGFIFSKNKKIDEKIKRLRFYGIESFNKRNKYYNKYYANENGFNSRIDEIQCSILNTKLDNIDQFINKRISLAEEYLKNLKKTDLVLPYKNSYNKHVYHLFTVFHPYRDKIIKLLNKKNVKTRIVYPYPIHKMKAYKKNFLF